MQYVIRERWFSWGDDFDIYDAAGKRMFFVDGRGISLRNKLSFQDTHGQELAFIEQARLGGGTEFNLSRGGRSVARVSKQSLSGSLCQFFVDVPGPDDITARGDFYIHNYSFDRQGRTLATVSCPDPNSGGYAVDIADGEDAVLLLAAVIVIDLISHEESGEGELYK
jgi:uncharacterized protein YxjI